MRNNRNVTIQFLGRRWGHQQIQALLRTLGQAGEVKVTCLWGQWYADVHYRGDACFDRIGHGKTMWTALANCLDDNTRRRETA